MLILGIRARAFRDSGSDRLNDPDDTGLGVFGYKANLQDCRDSFKRPSTISFEKQVGLAIALPIF